jgi:hypothetical protein
MSCFADTALLATGEVASRFARKACASRTIDSMISKTPNCAIASDGMEDRLGGDRR